MRKMFTVGLAAVMAMGLCACGSQKAAETTAAPAAAETTAAPSQDEKKEEAEERPQRPRHPLRQPAVRDMWWPCATIPSETHGGPRWNRSLWLRRRS